MKNSPVSYEVQKIKMPSSRIPGDAIALECVPNIQNSSAPHSIPLAYRVHKKLNTAAFLSYKELLQHFYLEQSL
jgi:hypothetical protein